MPQFHAYAVTVTFNVVVPAQSNGSPSTFDLAPVMPKVRGLIGEKLATLFGTADNPTLVVGTGVEVTLP